MRLEGKAGIVVGAGQSPGQSIGTGRAAAILFAREGAKVLLADRDLESARETARMIADAGGTAECVRADWTEAADCQRMATACVEAWGGIDFLQNNVGIGAGDSDPLGLSQDSFDRIIASGGYISVSTGSAPDGNAILVPKEASDRAMDATACIGCGACVAACPNASAALFTGAKIAHLGILPQGKPERDIRAIRMVTQMNMEGFGGCTNIGECTGVCPKEIPLEVIAAMNRDYLRGSWRERDNIVTTIRPFTEWSTGSKLQIDEHAGS